jgi:hypothetical protein
MIKRFLLLMLFASPLFAADDIVSWIGTTDRVIPASGPPVVNVPIMLAAPVTTAPQVRQVTFAGEEIDPDAVKVSWAGAELARTLSLTVDAAATKKIGTYTAVVHIATPDSAKYTERSLEVKLNRRGATLSIPAPLRAEHITYFGRYAEWRPEVWVISETSGRDGFTPAAKRWAVTLKTAETAPRGSLVYLDLLPVSPKRVKGTPAKPPTQAIPATTTTATPPIKTTTIMQEAKPTAPKHPPNVNTVAAASDPAPPTIAAGGQVLLKPVGHTDCCPFGTISGKFSLNEPQLTTPQEISVEVMSRLWPGWLPIIIISFIALGHYVRKVLEDRRSLGMARLAGNAVRTDLEALRTLVKGDPVFTQLVHAEQAKVGRVMGGNDAAAITNAVSAATSAITTIRTDYEKARKDAGDAVQKLRGVIGDVSALPQTMRTVAEEVDSQLGAIEASLTTGRATGVLAEAQAVEGAVVRNVRRALTPWRTEVGELLHEAKNWTDINTAVLAQVSEKVGALKSDTLEDTAAVFSTAAYADANVKAQAPRFVSEVGRIVTMVREGLGNTALKAPPDTLAGVMASDPRAAAIQLQSLRESVKKALNDAVPEGQQKPASIRESKFEEALAAVQAMQPPKDEALGDEAEVGPVGLPMESTRAPSIDAIDTADFSAEVEIDGEQIVGQTLQLTFRVIRNGAPVPHIDVQWWNGQTYLGAGRTFAFTPLSPAAVALTARTTIDARTIARTIRISATPAFVFDPDYLRGEIANVNWIQTAVAGAFITVIGYLIFEKAFIGTLADLVGAALWGFATDVTVAKVLEYAQPLLQRKPPFTTAAPAPAPSP